MKHVKFLCCLTVLAISWSACTKKQEANEVNFERDRIELENGVATIKLQLSAPATAHYPVKLNMTTTGVEMGKEFTIDPISIHVNGTVFITFPEGSQSQEFKIIRLGTAAIAEQSGVELRLNQVPEGLIQGKHNQTKVTFNHN